MALPEQLLEETIVAAVDDGGGTAGPLRVYALFDDYPPAPAMYAEFDVVAHRDGSDGGRGGGLAVDERGTDGGSDTDAERTNSVPVIIHNFRYYPLGMDRWDLGFVELLVMNELHELTHWAMTPDEREFFDERSRRYRRGDGYWLNPILLEVIDWLPGEHADVIEGSPSPSLGNRLRSWIGRVVARLELTGR